MKRRLETNVWYRIWLAEKDYLTDNDLLIINIIKNNQKDKGSTARHYTSARNDVYLPTIGLLI